VTLDRETWERKYRADADTRERDRRIAVAQARLQQAAVPLERLTGSEHWDTYLRLVQRLQDADVALLRDLVARLAAPTFLSTTELAYTRHDAAILQAQIATRNQLTELPRSIVASIQQSTDSVTQ
jgi:hypothetical protein